MKKLIVLIAAVAMVAAFAMPAAADVSLYGSARFNTYSVDRSSEVTGTAFSDRDTLWASDILSRFGATFKNGDIGGRFEMDARKSDTRPYTDTSHVGGLRLRLLYGTWNFGSGTLLIGQDYPVTDSDITSLQYTDAGMQGWGTLGYLDARCWQMKLKFGNFQVAALTPQYGLNVPAVYAPQEIDTILPKIEAGYELALEPVKFNFIGGWQSFDVTNTANDNSTSVASWVVGMTAKTNFGPAYLNGAVNYAINPGPYGLYNPSGSTYAPAVQPGTTSLKDATATTFAITAGYKISDMLNFELGYGKVMSSNDVTGPTGVDEDNAQAYYANLTVTLAPGVYFIPEFMVQDFEDIKLNSGATTKQGQTTIIGAFWKIDFK